MFCRISRFSTRLGHEPGEAASLLSRLEDQGVDLLGVTVCGAGSDGGELVLFTVDEKGLEKAARLASLALEGPHPAILVQREDRPGAFAEVLASLADSGARITSASAAIDGRGRFSCLVTLPAEEVARALRGLAEAA